MRSSFVVSAAIALALLAGAYAMLGDRGVPPPRAEPHAVRADAATQDADGTTPLAAERTAAPGPSSQPSIAAATATTPVLRVRLLGLDDAAPWTTSVSLEIDGADETGRAVDRGLRASTGSVPGGCW